MNEFIKELIERLEELKNRKVLKADGKPYGRMTQLWRSFGINEAIAIVNQLAEEYNGGWIPCSERLPEENEKRYLVQCEDGNMEIMYFCKGWNCTYLDVDKKRFFNGAERKDIIAWRELPAHYQPKGE